MGCWKLLCSLCSAMGFCLSLPNTDGDDEERSEGCDEE